MAIREIKHLIEVNIIQSINIYLLSRYLTRNVESKACEIYCFSLHEKPIALCLPPELFHNLKTIAIQRAWAASGPSDGAVKSCMTLFTSFLPRMI